MKCVIYRKMVCVLLMLALLFGMAACAQGSNNDQNVRNFEEKTVGLRVAVPNELFDQGVQEPVSSIWDDCLVMHISHIYGPLADPLEEEYNEKASQPFSEQLYSELISLNEEYQKHCHYLMMIFCVPKDKYESQMSQGMTLKQISGSPYDPVEMLGENDGYVYLISIPDLSTTGLSEEEIQQYLACKAQMDYVKEHLEFIPIENDEATGESGMPETMPTFNTVDLNGNAVTNEIFADKDLTVINIWGTYCSPCIEEMPELGKWAKEMPDNVQLMGLVVDVLGKDDTGTIDSAKDIMENAGAQFVNLILDENLLNISNAVVGVPTTIFVDSNGKLVGEPVVGASVEKYKQFVESYLNG